MFEDPDDPDAQLKDAEWDEKASVQAFRDLFAVSASYILSELSS